MVVEEAGKGRPAQLLAVVGVGDEVAPARGDALAAAGRPERHARDDLDEEVVGELRNWAPLRVALLAGHRRPAHKSTDPCRGEKRVASTGRLRCGSSWRREVDPIEGSLFFDLLGDAACMYMGFIWTVYGQSAVVVV